MAHGLRRRVPPRVMCGVPWQTGARAERRSKFKKAMSWGTEHLTSGPPLLSFHLASWVNHVASGTLPSPLGHLGSPRHVRLVLSPFCHPWVGKSTGLQSLLPHYQSRWESLTFCRWQAPSAKQRQFSVWKLTLDQSHVSAKTLQGYPA